MGLSFPSWGQRSRHIKVPELDVTLWHAWGEAGQRALGGGGGLEGKGVEGWRCCRWCGCWSRSGVARCHWAEPRGSTGQGGVINKVRQRKSRRSNDGRQDVPQQQQQQNQKQIQTAAIAAVVYSYRNSSNSYSSSSSNTSRNSRQIEQQLQRTAAVI